MRALVGAIAATAVVLAATGCGSSSETSSGDGPTVVATTTQIADFARNVVGDNGRVVQLLPANADAHDFEPTSDDLKAVAEADVILANGLHLDDWVEKLRESSGTSASVVVTTKGITARGADEDEHGHEEGDAHEATETGEDHDHGDHAEDPHAWMDPDNARIMVTNIADAMATAAPEHADAYRANAAAYEKKLTELTTKLDDMIATVPANERRIVTDHDAFGYLTDRFGITTVGTILPSLSTSAEPSAQDLARLADELKKAGVRVVFPEAAISPKLSEALAKEAGVRVGPVLYADSLGPEGSGAETYIEMMTTNMTALVEGMRG